MISRSHLLAAWRAVAWLGVAILVWLYVTPRPPELDIEQGDKLQHIAAYAVLTFWFMQLAPDRTGRWRSAAALAGFGVIMEFVQLATDYRTFSAADMAANTAGIALGLTLGPPRLPNVPETLARLLARED